LESLIRHAGESTEKGLIWIVDHLDLFVPEDPFNPENIKALAELSLLFGCLFKWRSGTAHPRLEAIQCQLIQFLDKPCISEWVRKLPAYYSPYLVAYLPLRSTGIRLPMMEEAANGLRRAGYPHGLEMTPYRELELQYLTWKAGISLKQPAWGTVYRRTALARCRNPIYFSLPEVYSVTHTLFYLTDFAGPAAIAPADRELALSIVEPLALHYWRKPDWDLTSELLLNLVALDRFETHLFCAAFKALQQSWRSDGSLPGPAFAELASDASRRDVFERCYHTTLVALLLCGALMHRVAERVEVRPVYA
jgi:hypothetical protein